MAKKVSLISLLAIGVATVGFFALSGVGKLKPTVAAPATTGTMGTTAFPTDNLQLWLKADVGVSRDADNHVTEWADQSGQKMDATQATAAAQPLLVSDAANGKPALRFDGKQSYLNLSKGFDDFSHGISMFAVVNLTGDSAWGRVIELNDGKRGLGIMRHDTFNTWEYFVLNGNWSPLDSWGGADLLPKQWQLIELVTALDGATTLYKNAAYPGTGSVTMPAITTYHQNYLGASPPNKQYWSGDFAEIMLYNTALSTDARKQVERYLLEKYAIQNAALGGSPFFKMKLDAQHQQIRDIIRASITQPKAGLITDTMSAADAEKIFSTIGPYLNEDGFEKYSLPCADGFTLNYRLYQPPAVTGTKYPLVLFFHGNGQQGSDNEAQMHCFPGAIWSLPELRKKYPCYIALPQQAAEEMNGTGGHLRHGWYADAAAEHKALIMKLVREHPDIDTRRIYLTGHSLGGVMVYCDMALDPDLYAGGLACDGNAFTDTYPSIYAAHQTKLLMFCGGEGHDFLPPHCTLDMAKNYAALGGQATCVQFQNFDHNQAGFMYQLEPGVLDWLFAQRK